MVEVIANADLTENDLPAPNADWGKIGRFALSFNGYEYWGSFAKCGEIANKSAKIYRETKVLPGSLSELRTCLFFEQRAWRHYGEIPDEQAMIYIHALIKSIALRISLGQYLNAASTQSRKLSNSSHRCFIQFFSTNHQRSILFKSGE